MSVVYVLSVQLLWNHFKARQYSLELQRRNGHQRRRLLSPTPRGRRLNVAEFSENESDIDRFDTVDDLTQADSVSQSLSKSVANPLHSQLEKLVDDFLHLAQSDASWQWLAEVGDPKVTIFRNPDLSPFSFKVRGRIQNTPATVFDLVTDVESRSEWDTMIVESRIIEVLDPRTRIVYMRTKPIWPTSSRDLVVLSHRRIIEWEMPDVDPSDGSVRKQKKRLYLNVTQSVEHASAPERQAEGIVRMTTGMAGQCVYEVQHEDGSLHSELIQIADSNPNGWIPASVVNFVATQAVPDGFLRLNKVAKGKPQIEAALLEGQFAERNMASSQQQAEDVGDDGKITEIPDEPPSIPPPVSSRKSPRPQASKRESRRLSHISTQTERSLARRAAPRHGQTLDQIQQNIETAMPWMVAIVFGVTVTNIAVRYLQYRRPSG